MKHLAKELLELLPEALAELGDGVSLTQWWWGTLPSGARDMTVIAGKPR